MPKSNCPREKILCSIEEDLNSIWFSVSVSEKRKRGTLFKMARLRSTLHKLKLSPSRVYAPEDDEIKEF